MLKLIELKDWAVDVRPIIFDLHVSYDNSVRLKENKYPHEETIKKNWFYNHHWYQLRFIMIIQFSKLLHDNKNQKRNFNKLITRLKSEKYDAAFLDQLKKNTRLEEKKFTCRNDILEKMSSLSEDLMSKEQLILNVIEARNKLYAHTDKTQSIEPTNLSKLKELLDLCDKLYVDIFGGIFPLLPFPHITHLCSIDTLLKEQSENMESLRKSLDL